MSPALWSASRTMSCIDVRWKPSRAKQAAAASRIWRRRAAKWASSTLGTGDRDAVELGRRLVAAERLQIARRGVPRGQVLGQAQAALLQVHRKLPRIEAERPRLAPAAHGVVPLLDAGEAAGAVQGGPVDVGEH